jgi:hypothetical protein
MVLEKVSQTFSYQIQGNLNNIVNDKNKIALLYEEVKKKIETGRTTPDNLKFDGLSIEWSSGFATFTFFGENLDRVAYSQYKTHPFIFNALKGAKNEIEMGSSISELKRHFSDYDVKLAGKPKDEDVVAFISKGQWDQDMGQTRVNTKSGRIWKDIASKTLNKKCDIIVFWCNEKDITKKELEILQNTFKLKNILYCAIDSHYFNEYSGGDVEETKDKGEKREFKSKLFPQLSHEDIVRILIKAHTSPLELTKAEKKVVDEFRGEFKRMEKEYGGYASKAEFEYRKKLSEKIENEIS